MLTDEFGNSINSLDVKKEKQSIIDHLKIPLSSISISRFFCELFVGQHSIGYLPVNISANGIAYDTSSEVVKKLLWHKVYDFSQREINLLIQKHLMLDMFHVVPTSFRRVLVEDDNDDLVASFDCQFVNSSWRIIDEKILATYSASQA